MSHPILDDKTDKVSIESFVRGTQVDLKSITIGTQLYYLYKEDDDTNHTIEFNWYWGCVIEMNKNKKNGEHYHIWHDDEDPWIDLSKDRTDWRVIPPLSKYYDRTFDINQYLIIHTNTQRHPNKKRSKSKKKSKKPSLSNTDPSKYEMGTPGFALMVPTTPIPCIITHGPVTFKAARLKPCSPTMEPYTFWCRSQDIKHIVTEKEARGGPPPKVAFEWNGQISHYMRVEEQEEKQFVECFWRKDVNKTWIAVDYFDASSKENGGELSQTINHAEGSQTANESQTVLDRNNKRRPSFKRYKHPKMEMDATPIPALSPVQQRSAKMDYSLSQPVNRMHENRQRKTPLSRPPIHSVANAVNTLQTASSIARYQRLQNQKFYLNPHHRYCQVHGNMQRVARPLPPRCINHSYSIPAARSRMMQYGGNAFSSPLHRNRSAYSAYHSHAGHKRKRNTNVSSNHHVLPPHKRQKLNDTMQLVAIQPPQPAVEVQMPELQRSPTPRHVNTKKYILSDDVSSIESGVDSESLNSNNDQLRAQPQAMEVVSENKMNCNPLRNRRRMSRRVSRSEPPPALSKRESHIIGFKPKHMTVWFPMISLSQITDQLTDKSISNKERIHGLKSVVLCLTKCQNTVNKISNQIGAQCENVIRCVEAIIQDLQSA